MEKEWRKLQDNMSCIICGQIHEGFLKCDWEMIKENKLSWLSDEEIDDLSKLDK